MKPETLAEVWAMIGFLIARRGQAPSTREAINAILARHVEQPAETEEQAAERLAEALWSERNDDTKRFWRERARLVREALRLAKETDNAD